MIPTVNVVQFNAKINSKSSYCSFHLSVVKPKPKYLLRSITTNVGNLVNKSELKAKTCSRRQARENTREQVTIRFGFTFDWLRK